MCCRCRKSADLNLDNLWQALNLAQEQTAGDMDELVLSFDIGGGNLRIVEDERYELLADCLHWFKDAKTFGSLIDVPAADAGTFAATAGTITGIDRYW